MKTDDVLFLKTNERLDNRPFTHLSHIAIDFHIMQSMVETLCLFLETRAETAFQHRPFVFFQDLAGGQRQRLVINHPRRLMMGHPFTLVGFFGQKKEDVDYLPLRNELDQALIAKFPNHPDLLSYSTLETISENYSNLVLFSRPEAKAHWKSSRTHARAVRELAPDYYASIRLYNGVLPRGLANSQALRLTRVKYYDYTVKPMWRAVRTLTPEIYGR